MNANLPEHHPILERRLGQQRIWRRNEFGNAEEWGTLKWLSTHQIHVQSRNRDWPLVSELPWFLSPLRPRGYLGRLSANSPSLRLVLSSQDPEKWSVEEQLYALTTQVRDGQGAFSIGDSEHAPTPEPSPTDDTERSLHYDRIAADEAHQWSLGSSAGGERPKFLANRRLPGQDGAQWEHLLVKFTAPRDTPFGERWHDLLHAEHLALKTLREAGEPVAESRVIESPTRTYFESVRFDRLGARGRRHAVGLEAIHGALVDKRALAGWVATTEALVLAGHMCNAEADRVKLWRAYGELIGNTDMHSNNLSLWADDPEQEHFTVAPCYDMLPMKYQPSSHGFDLNPIDLAGPRKTDATVWPLACRLARSFWQRVADHAACSADFRKMAELNAERIAQAR